MKTIITILTLLIINSMIYYAITTVRYVNHSGSNTPPYVYWATAADSIMSPINISVFDDTIHVPVEQPTIQAGIEVAQTGDLVLVADGTYIENIVFKGRNITLASYFILDGDETHIQNTIIDGSQPVNQNEGSTVTFRNYENSSSLLCGFTITGGIGTYVSRLGGGGIFLYLASPRIENNIVEGNIIDSPLGGTGAGICANIQYNDLINELPRRKRTGYH